MEALKTALVALEGDGAVEVGFAGDGERRLRREQWLVEKGARRAR